MGLSAMGSVAEECALWNDLNIPGGSGLLVVDVQQGFMTPETCHVPSRVGTLLSFHKDKFDVVVASKFINSEDSVFVRELGYAGCVDEGKQSLFGVVQDFADVVVSKSGYLLPAEGLQRFVDAGVSRVFVVGVDTDACVLFNTAAVFDLGLRPIVLAKACGSTGGAEFHSTGLRLIERTIGAHNVWD